MPKRIAICIGAKSIVNKEKIALNFEQYSTFDTLVFYKGPPNRHGMLELAAFLVQREPNADIWVVIQGSMFNDGKKERTAEEVQVLVNGAPLPYVDYLFWNDRGSPGEIESHKTEPEELFARKLFEMLSREGITKH